MLQAWSRICQPYLALRGSGPQGAVHPREEKVRQTYFADLVQPPLPQDFNIESLFIFTLGLGSCTCYNIKIEVARRITSVSLFSPGDGLRSNVIVREGWEGVRRIDSTR